MSTRLGSTTKASFSRIGHFGQIGGRVRDGGLGLAGDPQRAECPGDDRRCAGPHHDSRRIAEHRGADQNKEEERVVGPEHHRRRHEVALIADGIGNEERVAHQSRIQKREQVALPRRIEPGASQPHRDEAQDHENDQQRLVVKVRREVRIEEQPRGDHRERRQAHPRCAVLALALLGEKRAAQPVLAPRGERRSDLGHGMCLGSRGSEWPKRSIARALFPDWPAQALETDHGFVSLDDKLTLGTP